MKLIVEVGGQCFLEGINKLLLLLLYVLLVGVAHKVDVFADFTGPLLFWGVERLLLLELVEASRIDLGLELGAVRCLFETQCLPVDRAEELVLQDLSDTVAPETVLGIAHQSLEQIGSRWGQLSLDGDLQGLAPVKNFLTSDGGFI